MRIVELSTSNGRTFKVALANKNQEAILRKILLDNKKNKKHERFSEPKETREVILSISDLERIANDLI